MEEEDVVLGILLLSAVLRGAWRAYSVRYLDM